MQSGALTFVGELRPEAFWIQRATAALEGEIAAPAHGVACGHHLHTVSNSWRESHTAVPLHGPKVVA